MRRECRSHFHAGAGVKFGDQTLSLACHVPTGYVLIEHVLQFLFHDLGVNSRAPDAWPRILDQSIHAFHKRFTDRSEFGRQ
jgi:hypothetical protein